MQCPYCPAQEAAGVFEQHIKTCGSKTKECETCGELVQNWMMEQHMGSEICFNKLLDKGQLKDQ
jgi:hypothetical protein